MAFMPRDYKPATQAERGDRQKLYDDRRGSSAKRGYTGAWKRARAGYLAHHPLCVQCEREGRSEAATVVDHIKPHRGDMVLFWDSSNWQPLCTWHHSAWKQSLEKSQGV